MSVDLGNNIGWVFTDPPSDTTTATVELWEAGAFVATLGTVAVDALATHEFVINRALLSDPTGAGVELRVTSSASIDVETIVWDTESVAVEASGSGGLAGDGSLAATGSALAAAVASAVLSGSGSLAASGVRRQFPWIGPGQRPWRGLAERYLGAYA